MAEFKGATSASEIDATTARAHLPGLDIEIVHRRSPAGDAEQISISLQAVPSFEAFGRFLEAANPFAFWMGGDPPGLVPLARSRPRRDVASELRAAAAGWVPDGAAFFAAPIIAGVAIRGLDQLIHGLAGAGPVEVRT
ncbi:MAG TPA: hypothetical protein VH397_17530 [Xanthobacteraceae bacterium]